MSVVNVQVLNLPILQKTQFGQMATIVVISGLFVSLWEFIWRF